MGVKQLKIKLKPDLFDKTRQKFRSVVEFFVDIFYGNEIEISYIAIVNL